MKLETKIKFKLQILQIDRIQSSEYTLYEFINFYNKRGIQRQFAQAYMP